MHKEDLIILEIKQVRKKQLCLNLEEHYIILRNEEVF